MAETLHQRGPRGVVGGGASSWSQSALWTTAHSITSVDCSTRGAACRESLDLPGVGPSSSPRAKRQRNSQATRDGSILLMMAIDLNRVAGLLKTLNPTQEKVVRLYFGLGCQRSHSASEIARE